MAINVNVQYNGGFLSDIILWTQCYLYRGTCLNAMKRFCICSLLIPPKRFDIFSPITGGFSEGLGEFRFFFKIPYFTGAIPFDSGSMIHIGGMTSFVGNEATDNGGCCCCCFSHSA